jgi:hypothetical protein
MKSEKIQTMGLTIVILLLTLANTKTYQALWWEYLAFRIFILIIEIIAVSALVVPTFRSREEV